MKTAKWASCVALTALWCAGPQTPIQEHDPSTVGRLLWRIRAGSPEERDEAWRLLQLARDVDYASLLERYATLEPGTDKAVLEQVLMLPELRDATHVFVGTLRRVVHDQGGAIDYHWLTGHLTDARLLRGDEETRSLLEDHGQYRFVRGTSEDWWLSEVIRRDLSRFSEQRVWITRSRRLTYDYSDGNEAAVRVLEYRCLPGSAAEAVAGWLRSSSRGARR
jgi:hypothetical protein